MRFRRRLSPNVNINLVPMIDVVFQLIIFFMVATVFNSGIRVELASSSTGEPLPSSSLTISVRGEDEIYLNRSRYTLQTLGPALAALAPETAEEEKQVTIEADADVRYQLMIWVLDVVRTNGFHAANLPTRPAGRNPE
ncbi:MAG TPA: biopolymer transporter ExbD [Spirochaetia bacterium]|mgnify:CR=1 FL=1|nr:biopolymer transporter ExbD [Spirochaetia bacterium]